MLLSLTKRHLKLQYLGFENDKPCFMWIAHFDIKDKSQFGVEDHKIGCLQDI